MRKEACDHFLLVSLNASLKILRCTQCKNDIFNRGVGKGEQKSTLLKSINQLLKINKREYLLVLNF